MSEYKSEEKEFHRAIDRISKTVHLTEQESNALAEVAKKMGEQTLHSSEEASKSLRKLINCIQEETEEVPLLRIELEDETSVPKVFYKGEEITNKLRVSFDWETQTEELGGTRYNIEHFIDGQGHPTKKGYGLTRGKYIFDGED